MPDSRSDPLQPILIRGGRLITPGAPGKPTIDRTRDLAIEDGVVKAIAEDIGESAFASPPRVIDAADMIVTPGLVDPHVHFREPGQEEKETIATGSRAAVAGGFTAVCCMPNTRPPLDTEDRVRWVVERARETAACRVFPIGAATMDRQGEEMCDLEALRAAGAVGFSDDGDVIASGEMMRRVLVAAGKLGVAVMQHCQDPAMTRGSVMHEGDVSRRLGVVGWPREAEEGIVERDIDLVRQIDEAGGFALARESGRSAYHVQHISSAGSVEMIRQARAEGLPVSAEASPHHLHLTDEVLDANGTPNTLGKVNPPVRDAADREAIRQGVADGTISLLATDHAPHTDREKAKPIAEAPFGLIGLETAVSLYSMALVETGLIGWARLAEVLTTEPAALCGLGPVGRLEIGHAADVTIFDPALEWVFDVHECAGRSHNSPFLGRALKGRAVATIVGGRLVRSLA